MSENLALGISSDSTFGTNKCQLEEYYNPGRGPSLCVGIPVAFSGTSIANYTGVSSGDTARIPSIWGVNFSAALSGLATGSSKLFWGIKNGIDSGSNISGENKAPVDSNGDPALLNAAALALSVAALYPPFTPLGVAAVGLGSLSLISAMVPDTNMVSDMSSVSGCSVHSSLGDWYQQYFIDNGTFTPIRLICTASDTYCGNFSNVFSGQEYVHFQIYLGNFANDGCLNLSALSYYMDSEDTTHTSVNDICPYSPEEAASSTLRIPLVPAHTLEGKVVDASNGMGLANQKVLIRLIFPIAEASKCVGYVVTTNASGGYRFFADPGYQYNVSLCSDPSSGQYLSASSTNNEGTTNINFAVSPVNVAFNESGLPSGTSWSVSVGYNYSGTGTGSTIDVSAPPGSYTYYIDSPVTVRHSNGDVYIYQPITPSGPITITSGGQTIRIGYQLTAVEYPVGGGGGYHGCVNGTTEILMANFTYMHAQYILPGDYILAYNITTHEYQPEEVFDTYISEHTTQYTINGFLETSAYQPLLTNHGYVKVENLTSKDRIFDAFTGQYVKISSITESTGHFKMYDFQIPPDYDFIAWEYVVYDLTIEP